MSPVELLTDYIASRSLTDTVRPYYGVDQGDRRRVEAIVEDEFGDRPIDLVIDDASHLYEPTLASFEVLFPRVAPNGLYVIEDWRWEHKVASAIEAMIESGHEDAGRVAAAREQKAADVAAGVREAETPFSRLVMELLLARAEGDHIADVRVNASWVVIRRSPGRLDPATFRLRDLYRDHFDQLATGGAVDA